MSEVSLRPPPRKFLVFLALPWALGVFSVVGASRQGVWWAVALFAGLLILLPGWAVARTRIILRDNELVVRDYLRSTALDARHIARVERNAGFGWFVTEDGQRVAGFKPGLFSREQFAELNVELSLRTGDV